MMTLRRLRRITSPGNGKLVPLLPSQRPLPNILRILFLTFMCCLLTGCAAISTTYDVATGTVNGGVSVVKGTCDVTVGTTKAIYHGAKGTYNFAAGTTKTVYHIGEFTFEVVQAPLDWPLLNGDIDTIDGLPVKEAIQQGRVKNSPYTVGGTTYYPMSIETAQTYVETGTASWYGYETRRKRGGYMTANGEAFDPRGLTAAHKLLPLPTNVRVTNLENNRSIIVRVNDRGPFPCKANPRSGERIIDLSFAAAKKLGYHDKGTALVRVEAIPTG
jgi:rare lipoprotein A